MAGGNEVVEDLVGQRLVEHTLVAVFVQVVLQGLQLDAGLIGRVDDPDLAKVGETGFGAHRSELWTTDGDLVVTFGSWIWKCLERHGP